VPGTTSGVPFVLMRGGTSKCVFLKATDLPEDRAARDDALLAIFGSPDPRQIDGLGGATSTTSKAMIVDEDGPDDADVAFTFAQISITDALVDTGGTCGNCSSAVGPYAVDAGLVEMTEPVTEVRCFNRNTGKYLIAEVPVEDGRASRRGDHEIQGVPGTGPRIKMWFTDPGGAQSGSLLPTGNVRDELDLDGTTVSFSFVDAVNPVAFVQAEAIGATGRETPREIEGDPRLLDALERVRGAAAVHLGLVDDPADARARTPGIPKVAMVGAPGSYETVQGQKIGGEKINLVARIMSMGTAHEAYALSGGLCTAVAAGIEGSVVADLLRSTGGSADGGLVLGHASGTMRLEVDVEPTADGVRVRQVAGTRTARRIAEGSVYIDHRS
jgi:methylitaconate Delta-isomerase